MAADLFVLLCCDSRAHVWCSPRWPTHFLHILQACSIHECGFDAGDCGTKNYDKMYEVKMDLKVAHYTVPRGGLLDIVFVWMTGKCLWGLTWRVETLTLLGSGLTHTQMLTVDQITCVMLDPVLIWHKCVWPPLGIYCLTLTLAWYLALMWAPLSNCTFQERSPSTSTPLLCLASIAPSRVAPAMPVPCSDPLP